MTSVIYDERQVGIGLKSMGQGKVIVSSHKRQNLLSS